MSRPIRLLLVCILGLVIFLQVILAGMILDILSPRQRGGWGPIAGSFDRCAEYWKVKKRGGKEYLHVYPGGFREMRKDILLDPPPSATPGPDPWQLEPALRTPLAVEL